MPRILIVDDEPRIRELVKKYAAFEGIDVAESGDGMDAVEKCRLQSFDLIVMDAMLPGLDGYSAVWEIRKTSDVPVIMLSARGEEYDRLHGFETGADDYVVKPFSPRELMMRVTAILRRSAKAQDKEREIYESEGIRVDFTARQVQVDGQTVEMTPKEYDLFFFLVRNRGVALTRETLIGKVWGYDFSGDDRTLDTHIKLLRKSLGSQSHRVVTLRGVGYRFEG